MIGKLLEIYGWVRYFFTRQRYTIKLSDQAKEFIAQMPKDDMEGMFKLMDKMSKNPYIGRPVKNLEDAQNVP